MYIPPVKPFTFSYSRLKNFEVCPRRHHEIDLLKHFVEDEGEALRWGNAVHGSMAQALATGIALPPAMKHLEHWVDRVHTMRETYGARMLVEQKLAFTESFEACGYFDRGVWFRGVVDVILLYEDVALIIDWKTGKILDDSQQLALFAQCVFSHHKNVNRIRTIFAWLKEEKDEEPCISREDFEREDMPSVWNNLWPRVEALKTAHATDTYPPKPGRLCRKWCPVTSCQHHGT